MSLINQMLKDLDARHEGEVRGKLHREVRPLPAADANRGLRVAIMALLALALLAALWWAYQRAAANHPVAPVIVAEAVAPAPAPVQPGTPQPVAEVLAPPAAPAAPVPAVSPATTETPAAAPATMPLDEASGLKLSAGLERLPEESPVAQTPAKPVRSPPVRDARADGALEKAAATQAGKTTDKTAKAEPATKLDTAPARVEKQPAARSERERSETDYRRALALVNGARVAEATDLLLDVLRRDGGHTASRQLLARLLIEQRRLDEAYAILAEGVALQPGQVGWAMTLARLQVERGDLSGAARTLQGAQEYARGNADYLGFAGHVHYRLGDYRAASERYQGAVRIAPNEGRWWLGLGLALEAEQRIAEARDAFLRARATGTLNADLLALVDQKLR